MYISIILYYKKCSQNYNSSSAKLTSTLVFLNVNKYRMVFILRHAKLVFEIKDLLITCNQIFI